MLKFNVCISSLRAFIHALLSRDYLCVSEAFLFIFSVVDRYAAATDSWLKGETFSMAAP